MLLGMTRLILKTERMKVCESCERYEQNFKFCGECGCFMPVKTAIPMMRCPLEKW